MGWVCKESSMMPSLSLITKSPEATRRLGERLGRLLEPGHVVLLWGELGSGKTCLAQGIARGLGVQEWVGSPTFVLLGEYQGNHRLYHADFYRIENPQEAADLALEEYTWDGVLLVEWPERAWSELSQEHLLVRLEALGSRERRLTLEARGEAYQKLLEALESSRRPGRRRPSAKAG